MLIISLAIQVVWDLCLILIWNFNLVLKSFPTLH
jgi:hypothetical protein